MIYFVSSLTKKTSVRQKRTSRYHHQQNIKSTVYVSLCVQQMSGSKSVGLGSHPKCHPMTSWSCASMRIIQRSASTLMNCLSIRPRRDSLRPLLLSSRKMCWICNSPLQFCMTGRSFCKIYPSANARPFFRSIIDWIFNQTGQVDFRNLFHTQTPSSGWILSTRADLS